MKLTVIAYWKYKTISFKKYIDNLNFSDEILLIGNDLDHSVNEITKSDKLKTFPLDGKEMNSSIKNYLLSKAKGKWVFFINSDEVVNKSLGKEIKEKINSSKFDGYYVKIIDLLRNKLIHTNEYINMYQLRLGKKNRGKWESECNENETWELNGNMGILKKPLIRIVNPSLEELLSEMNSFTTFRANELFMENKKVNILTLVFFPIGKFIIDFFLKRGFLFGIKGFVYAATMSFRTFLTRAKLWLLWKNENS